MRMGAKDPSKIAVKPMGHTTGASGAGYGNAKQPPHPYEKKPAVAPKGFSAPTGTWRSLGQSIKGRDVKIDPALGHDPYSVPPGSGFVDPGISSRPTKNFPLDVDPEGSSAKHRDPAGAPWATKAVGGFETNYHHSAGHDPILNIGKAKNFGKVNAYRGMKGTETSAGAHVLKAMKPNQAKPKSKTSDKGY